MVPTEEACAECTQNCVLMHKKDKNPSSVATTFFKVMFGDDYSKVMFFPPRFARSINHMVGKETELEDPIGEKWTVKLKRIDGLLAFEEGWNNFSLDHGLKPGDLLVFHYITGSHFVVLMYGHSGCPEIQHYGITRNLTKKTGRKGKMIADDHSPSHVNTNGHHCPNESSSSRSERFVDGAKERPEIRKKKRIRIDDTTPPNVTVNMTNANHHSAGPSCEPGPSVSVKETGQRSEPLVTNTTPDKIVYETPKTVEPFCLVDRDTGNAEDEYRRSCLHDLSIFETRQDGPNGGPVEDGGGQTLNDEPAKVVETRFEEPEKRPKERAVTPSEPICYNSIKTRLRKASSPTKITEKAKRVRVGTSNKDDTVKTFRVTRASVAKKEPVSISDTDILGSRLHNVSITPPYPGIFQKVMAKPMEVTRKEPTMAHGSYGGIGTSSGYKSKDTNTACDTSVKKEEEDDDDDILLMVKPEPVDYDEEPPPGASSASFSAVMSSYRYLELPKWVRLQSKVILLRNGADLWPVLYRKEFGLKTLTHCWEAFARARGIQPGNECEFELERAAGGANTCCVYKVLVK